MKWIYCDGAAATDFEQAMNGLRRLRDRLAVASSAKARELVEQMDAVLNSCTPPSPAVVISELQHIGPRLQKVTPDTGSAAGGTSRDLLNRTFGKDLHQ